MLPTVSLFPHTVIRSSDPPSRYCHAIQLPSRHHLSHFDATFAAADDPFSFTTAHSRTEPPGRQHFSLFICLKAEIRCERGVSTFTAIRQNTSLLKMTFPPPSEPAFPRWRRGWWRRSVMQRPLAGSRVFTLYFASVERKRGRCYCYTHEDCF